MLITPHQVKNCQTCVFTRRSGSSKRSERKVTDDCNHMYSNYNQHIVKLADDCVIMALPSRSDQLHGPIMQEFVDWCDR